MKNKDLFKKITGSFSPKNLLFLGVTSLSLYLAPMLLSKASAQPLNKVNLEETLNKANPTNPFQVDTAWVRRYNGPGNNADGAYAMAVDGSGNIYVTGWSTGIGTSMDYATIKYIQDTTGIQEKPSERLENRLQAYPNPTKDISTINYSLAKPSHVNLNLYNSVGEKIKTLVDKFEDIGNKSIRLNTKALASGVYFYILTIDEKSTSKKVVVSH